MMPSACGMYVSNEVSTGQEPSARHGWLDPLIQRVRPTWMIPILKYHRIGTPTGDHVPTGSPDAFAWHINFLHRTGRYVMDFSEMVDRLELGAPLPRNGVVITFDDGYVETATVAAPLLQRFRFRATVFVAPAEMGTPGFMTWEQLRGIADNGLSIGSHTLTHAYLPLTSREQMMQELRESKAVLEQELGRAIEWLSYPIGGFTPDIQRLAHSSGYRAACTTNRGIRRDVVDLFALRRIKITERDCHPLVLQAKLSGYYNHFRRLKHPA